MSKYKCVIFDCDGVLIDSEMITVEAMVDMVIIFCLDNQKIIEA